MANSPLETGVHAGSSIRSRMLLVLLVAALCTGGFFTGFALTESRMELWRKEAVKAVEDTALWGSYTEVSEFTGLPEQNIKVQGKIRQNPELRVYAVEVPVTDGSRFQFNSYQTGGRVWIHDRDQDKWIGAPVSHPALSEIKQLEASFALWAKIISQAEKAERTAQGATTQYRLQTSKFPYGELHGYSLIDAADAKILVVAGSSGQLQKLEAVINFAKHDVLQAGKITYRIEVSGINSTEPDPLPAISEWTELP